MSDKEFKRSKLPHCGDYAMSWLPTPFVFCKKRGREKAKAMARSNLSIEMNMIELIKQQRYFVAGFKKLLTQEQRLELKE